MYKIITLIVISSLILSCRNQTQKKELKETSVEKTSSFENQSKIATTNYAVIWKWSTTNSQLVADNTVKMSNEMNNLWQQKIVENIYYDSESKIDKLSHFPNISFFMKAKNTNEAESILNELTVVIEDIATYRLYPVGHLWLKRNDEIARKNRTKSFVTVWSTTNNSNSSDDIIKQQNDMMLELWNKGVVENAYFDIEGTQQESIKSDFVFFVNADTREEAESICNSLPFSKEGIATYKMYQSGVFWMGQYENETAK